MTKEAIIQQLLAESIDPGVKYPSLLPPDIARWYVYTRESGHRILCVPAGCMHEGMDEAEYREHLVSAPVKTVLRGYFMSDDFVVVDLPCDECNGFATENSDREFDESAGKIRYKLTVGELYLPGTTKWPEAVEYNYFSGNHELRFFVKNPTRYITEVISRMAVHLGLFIRDDIILFVYRFTDYKKKFIPVHGYSPFSIHLVPADLRKIPEKITDPDHEEILRIHLVDAATGILKAARTVRLSPAFSSALCEAIYCQASIPLSDDYNERLLELDRKFVDNESLMNNCGKRCSG
ncbi:MAG: hypothetical protein GXY14_11055 [Spirochaetes bacterium]|nr:hypothetical protein [Spirochaetota bacterium]